MGANTKAENLRIEIINRLLQLVRERLSKTLIQIEGARLQRFDIKSLRSYNRSHKFSELEEWLTEIVAHMEVTQMGGSSLDHTQVLTIGELLEGQAKQWFNRHVLSVRQEKIHWSFEDVISQLYDRFVHPTMMRDGLEQFKAILEVLLKWEDKLIGFKLHIITDHKALEFFKEQNTVSNRQ